MCGEKRECQSSIRYSKKVKDIVNTSTGKTFADRFERVVLDFEEKKEERENYLKAQSYQIERNIKELNDLRDKIENARKVFNKLDVINNTIDSILEM